MKAVIFNQWMVAKGQIKMQNESAIMVTVTYGKRWNFLRECIQSALDDGVDAVIVIDNNSKENIEDLCSEYFPLNVHVFKQDQNIGSSGGYSLGIKLAIDRKFDYIFLLDDDNKIIQGTYKKLKSRFDDLLQHYQVTKAIFALCAYRPMHEPEIATGSKILKLYTLSQSFFGFHFLDLPIKIIKRLPFFRNVTQAGKPDKFVELNKAVWSGLFFHKDLISNIGLPIAELMIYSDDIEFTQRIIQRGGKIVLNTDAPLFEMDKSWNVGNNVSNSFDNYLLAEGDFRIYYAIRNQAYIESHKMVCGLLWKINKNIYLGLLLIRALFLLRLKRWQLIYGAVEDGRRAKLGVNKEFPLT